jgi:hypothetical protein
MNLKNPRSINEVLLLSILTFVIIFLPLVGFLSLDIVFKLSADGRYYITYPCLEEGRDDYNKPICEVWDKNNPIYHSVGNELKGRAFRSGLLSGVIAIGVAVYCLKEIRKEKRLYLKKS